MAELSPPRIAILPYGTKITLKLSEFPLSDLNWPLGKPVDIDGKTIADLTDIDHLLCYITSRLFYVPRPQIKAKISTMIVEPYIVHRRNILWMRLFYTRFFKVLTANTTLLKAIPNALSYVFGSTWVPEWKSINLEKSRLATLIASGKKSLPGHRLRHEVVNWISYNKSDVNVVGRGYEPFDQKHEALAAYRYSVVIENVREPSYFTEKLIDCLLCKTIPIYWGAPDIGSFFEAEGMIICNNFEDIATALANISEADYQKRLDYLSTNQLRAARYADHEKAAAFILSKAAKLKTADK
jgi:Glycosyltransferase family 10 (fucosyltransferase) C-term